MVGHARAPEGIFKHPGKGIGAVKHRYVLPLNSALERGGTDPVGLQPLGPINNEARFVVLITAGDDLNGDTALAGSNQRLVLALRVHLDEPIRDCDDGVARAEIFAKRNNLHARE